MSETIKNSAPNLTPLMRQYWDIKSLHEDKILLFRMGDFFEMFFNDAVTAAPILGIALTSRNKKSQDETPMCGMPHHSVAGPINKLLKHGLKVAICDQMEDPKFAKGIVKRAITRVLSPGMVYDSDTLESTQAHYLASFGDNKLACIDTTTGEAFILTPVSKAEALRLFSLLPIAEVVASQLSPDLEFLRELTLPLTLVDSDFITEPERVLLQYIMASGSAEVAKTLKPFEVRSLQGRMDLSTTVLRHLEIFSNSRGENQGTLFSCINRTQTSAGARLLRQRLSFPLIHLAEINLHLDEVEKWIKDLALVKRVREVLGRMGDVERRLGKVAQPQCNGRDLRALSESTLAGIEALQLSKQSSDTDKKLFQNTEAQLRAEILKTSLQKLADKILFSLVEEPPLSIKQGYLINKGVSTQLDELILLTTDSQSLLQQMEAREKEKTGISSLKIRYNNVFGFYIEVTHTHKDKIPSHYMRKQTLANAERYCTDELVALEKNVLSAQTRRFELEAEIFEDLRRQVLTLGSEFLQLAQLSAELDVATANAWLAVEKNYSRPRFGSSVLNLKNSRHSVVEQTVKQAFTPNTIQIEKGGCLLLTGPNMAGKSTLMRQVALTVIMGQSGLYVPAEDVEMPIFNHIFTRIGASDQLSEGLSTFMVEMTETAEMLKKAGSQSLLILDEIGRGTSTFDGMSLAQSILEFILNQVGAMTLFATHYHELTGLEKKFSALKNAHMKVVEKNGQIQFLHTLTRGPAQKSYGIHVAKLAGVPSEVTKRAEEILRDHEELKANSKFSRNTAEESSTASLQMSLLEIPQVLNTAEVTPHPLLQAVKELDLMSMTPLQALQKLADLQTQLSIQ